MTVAVAEKPKVEAEEISIFPEFEFNYFKSSEHPDCTNHGMAEYAISPDYYFCYIGADYKQVTIFSPCRAWLVDTLHAFYQDKDLGEVYFRRNYSQPDLDNIRIGVSFTTRQGTTDDEMMLVLDFLNKVEAAFGFEPTKCFRASNVKKHVAYMLVGDKRWLVSCQLISLYTLLIRNVVNVHKLENTWEQTLDKRAELANNRNFYHRDNSVIERVNIWVKKFAKFNPMTFFKDDKAVNFNPLIKTASDTHGFGIDALSLYVKGQPDTIQSCSSTSSTEAKEAVFAYACRFKDESEIEAFLASEKPK